MSNSHNRDPVRYPILARPQNPNRDPFVVLNESNLPNYTEPGLPKSHAINTIKSSHSESEIPTASSIATSFNIIKGIMGVGLLALPWSMANVGLTPSIISMLVSFVFSYICWIFLSVLCSKYDVYNYRDIGLITFGNKFATGLDILLLLYLSMCCIVYVVFLSEFMMEGLAQFNINIDTELSFGTLWSITSFKQLIASKFGVITIAIYFILFPLCLLNRLDSLKYSSFLGIIGCMYAIGLVVYTYVDDGCRISNTVFSVNYHSYDDGRAQIFWYWMGSFSIFVATFSNHYNCPALLGELRDKSTRKFAKIAAISFALVLVFNALIGLFGYFTFGTDLNQNIFDSMNQGLVAGIARLIMALTIIGTYPLLFWNIKISIDNLFLYENVTNTYHTSVEKIPRKYTCLCSKVFIYFVLTSIIWVISVYAIDVAVMINFVQSFLGNAITFVFPGVFYLEMLKEKSNESNLVKTVVMTMICYIVVIFGTISVVAGCVASIMFWIGYIH